MNHTAKLVVSVVGLVVLLAVGVVLWLYVALSPVSPKDETVHNFTVKKGESVDSVLSRLEADGLLRSKLAGRLVMNEVKAGVYNFTPAMTGWRILQSLQGGKADVLVVTVPEGFTEKQIADTLDKANIVSREDFLKSVQDPKWRSQYDFLTGSKAGTLEGFLFPDTYFFAPGTPADEIVMALLDNFENKFSEITLPKNMKPYDFVILASMVEREARTSDDMKGVASVLENRIAAGMRLDVDATVRYALDKWKSPLTATDLQLDSPYNTRKVKGLPPTPIANPGVQAMLAVANAPKTNYLYYLTDNDGVTHFSVTLEEHNQKKQQYLS